MPKNSILVASLADVLHYFKNCCSVVWKAFNCEESIQAFLIILKVYIKIKHDLF